MRKPIIGILGRKEKTTDEIPFYGNMIGYDYMKALDKLDVNYIGIITNDTYKIIDEDVLKLCDGFLFTGGNEMKEYHHKIIEYCYKNKIPVLGICLGCQIIGTFFDQNKIIQKVSDITNEEHNPLLPSVEARQMPVHNVNIKENSILYTLFGPQIMVNSRHNYCLKNINSPLKQTANSNDGIIEGIELINEDQFIIGIQWHAENMDNMNLLFKEYIKNVKQKMSLK